MTEARSGQLRHIGYPEKAWRTMLVATTIFAGGTAGGVALRNAIDNPPEIPPIAAGLTGPLAKDLVVRDPEVTLFAQPTPPRILMADLTPSPSSTATLTVSPTADSSPTTRLPTSTVMEAKAIPTPLGQMVAIGNIDVFLGPGERKVGYFVPGQKFTPTGVISGDYTQVSDGKNTLWVKSGGSYQAIDEVPQVASRPPAQAPPPPPTRPPESAPTATRQPEIARAFPKEIRSVEGLIIHNMGTRYGIDIYDGGFRGPDGTYNPGGGRTGYDSGLRQENLNYVQAVFAKYRNLPNGGKGRNLEIFFYDSPRGYPFADKSPYVLTGNDTFYRYGQLVGNTIEVHIGLGENFGPAPTGSKPWERVVFEIDAATISMFLLGYHDYIINRTNGNKSPIPKDIDYIAIPHKFDLITSNAS